MSSSASQRTVPPWWAGWLVTIMLLALASRMIVSQDQLAIAGAIVGYVAGHWLPIRGNTTREDLKDG